MRPWDNSLNGPIKTNESRNPFAGMIRQLIGHVSYLTNKTSFYRKNWKQTLLR